MKHASWIAIASLTLAASTPAFAQWGGGPPPPPPTQGGGSAPTPPGGSGPSTPAPGGPGAAGPNTPRPGDVVPTGGGAGPVAPGRPAYTGPLGPPAGPMTPRTPGAVTPGTPGLGAPVQPSSPRGNGVTGDDPGSWRVWWTLNHDRYVDVAARAPSAVSDGGVKDRTAVPQQVRADAYERLVPIVRRVIQQEKNEILLGRALIAFAKLGEDPRVPHSREAYKTILPFVNHEKSKVAESAALALGILGHDDAIMSLSQFASAAPNAQAGNQRAERVRSFAIYGLGLVARDAQREDVRRVAASRLCSIFGAEKGLSVDIKFACLQALSVVPLASDTQAMALPGGGLDIPSASRSAEIEWLLRVLDSTDEATWVRAQASISAARLCVDQPESSKLRARVVERLLEAMSGDYRDALPMRQSAALALGQLGDGDIDAQDVAVREALTEALRNNSDQPTRYYAAMSLAQVASRPGGGTLDPQRLAAGDDVREILIRRLGAGSETERAWTALSLGVFEYRMRHAGESPSADTHAALLGILSNSRSPEVGAATALALGLSGAVEAKDELIEQLKSGDPNVKSYAALALGMIGAKEAQPLLEKMLERAEGSPEIYVPVSEGLAMLGTPVADRLVKSLGSGLSLESQLAACVALGRTGGARAVQPLTDMVGDSTGTSWVRALAVEALGSIGDHGATRWNACYGFDVNFLALPLTATAPTLDGVLDLE